MRGVFTESVAQGRIILSGNGLLPYKVLVGGEEYAAQTMRTAEMLLRKYAGAASAPRVHAVPRRQTSHLRLVVDDGAQ